MPWNLSSFSFVIFFSSGYRRKHRNFRRIPHFPHFFIFGFFFFAKITNTFKRRKKFWKLHLNLIFSFLFQSLFLSKNNSFPCINIFLFLFKLNIEHTLLYRKYSLEVLFLLLLTYVLHSFYHHTNLAKTIDIRIAVRDDLETVLEELLLLLLPAVDGSWIGPENKFSIILCHQLGSI